MRYEDKVTNPDHPFACGIILKQLSAESTNEKWQVTHIDAGASQIHKVSLIHILINRTKLKYSFNLLSIFYDRGDTCKNRIHVVQFHYSYLSNWVILPNLYIVKK